MADTDTYQPDAAGSGILADAQSKTADAAAKQSAQNKAGAAAAVKGGQDAADAKTARTQKAGASTAKGASYQNQPGQAQEPAAGSVATVLGGAKTGMDKVPKTGAYGLTKGETVLPEKQASAYRKVFESRGAAGKHKWGGK